MLLVLFAALTFQAPPNSGFWGDPALGDTVSAPAGTDAKIWKQHRASALESRRDEWIHGRISPDPVFDAYLAKVLDSTISRLDLRQRLSIHTCASPYPNATMSPAGSLILTRGLLARLDDEAQLAAVIAHEAAHFAYRHGDLEWQRTRDKPSWAESRTDRWETTLLHYSRTLEFQADSFGLEMLRNSRYRTAAMDSTLGMLARSEQPIGLRPWTRSAFSALPDLGIPDSFWNPAAQLVDTLDTDDSSSTHPAVPKRREALKPRLLPGGQAFLVSKELFLQLRNQSRRQLPLGWLQSDQPALALFESWSQLETAPNDTGLQRIYWKSLVDLALDKGAVRRLAPRIRRARQTGPYASLRYFLARIDGLDLAVLAILEGRKAKWHKSAEDSLWEKELWSELASAYPRQLDYWRDSSQTPTRSIRHQQARIDRLRRVLPLPRTALELPDVADSSWQKRWVPRRPVALPVFWSEDVPSTSLENLAGARRVLREALLASLDLEAAPDPATWSPDSVAAARALREVWRFWGERGDPRGAQRFRPLLPGLRKALSRWNAGQITLVRAIRGKQASGGILAFLSSSSRLEAVVIDLEDGAVVAKTSAPLSDTPDAADVRRATKLLVDQLKNKITG